MGRPKEEVRHTVNLQHAQEMLEYAQAKKCKKKRKLDRECFTCLEENVDQFRRCWKDFKKRKKHMKKKQTSPEPEPKVTEPVAPPEPEPKVTEPVAPPEPEPKVTEPVAPPEPEPKPEPVAPPEPEPKPEPVVLGGIASSTPKPEPTPEPEFKPEPEPEPTFIPNELHVKYQDLKLKMLKLKQERAVLVKIIDRLKDEILELRQRSGIKTPVLNKPLVVGGIVDTFKAVEEAEAEEEEKKKAHIEVWQQKQTGE